jgi:hypothetical protein
LPAHFAEGLPLYLSDPISSPMPTGGIRIEGQNPYPNQRGIFLVKQHK